MRLAPAVAFAPALAGALVLALGPCGARALAQSDAVLARPVQAPAPPPPVTPEQLAAGAAEASRLIAEAKAERYFEAIPAGVNSASFRPEARVRHRTSGVVCTFPQGEPGARIELLRTAAAPGEDFVCHSQTASSETMSVHVARYAKMPALGQVLEALEQSMRQGLVDAKPIALPRPGPATQFIRLQGERDGMAVIEAAAADIAGGWIVEQRQTVPLSTGRLAITRGGFVFTGLIRALSPPPVAAKGP